MSGTAWSGSTRRARLPADWPARRDATRERAGGRCEWSRICRALPALSAWTRGRGRLTVCRQAGSECDHIQRGDDHAPRNLAWICGTHHRMKSAWEGGTARGTTRRPPEQHPGLLPARTRARRR